jgi:hypothetical protein
MAAPDPRLAVDPADRLARVAAQFKERGIELSEQQAVELVAASDRLQQLKETVRSAATRSSPRRS